MIRRPIFSLVSVGAILGTLGTAQAGTSITYYWVTPSPPLAGTAGEFFFVGSITVNSSGLSATPIDLTAAMIESWQITAHNVSDPARDFSLTSSANLLDLSTNASFPVNQDTVAPEITTTNIFLPTLSLPSGITHRSDSFVLENAVNIPPSVTWESNLDSVHGFSSATIVGLLGQSSISSSTTNSDVIIATVVPEPASLVIWSLAAGVFGVWQIRKRRRSSTAV
jgi:hypothetical protein